MIGRMKKARWQESGEELLLFEVGIETTLGIVLENSMVQMVRLKKSLVH